MKLMGLASRVLTYWLRIALYCAQIQLLVKHKNVVCVRVFFLFVLMTLFLKLSIGLVMISCRCKKNWEDTVGFSAIWLYRSYKWKRRFNFTVIRRNDYYLLTPKKKKKRVVIFWNDVRACSWKIVGGSSKKRYKG